MAVGHDRLAVEEDRRLDDQPVEVQPARRPAAEDRRGAHADVDGSGVPLGVDRIALRVQRQRLVRVRAPCELGDIGRVADAVHDRRQLLRALALSADRSPVLVADGQMARDGPDADVVLEDGNALDRARVGIGEHDSGREGVRALARRPADHPARSPRLEPAARVGGAVARVEQRPEIRPAPRRDPDLARRPQPQARTGARSRRRARSGSTTQARRASPAPAAAGRTSPSRARAGRSWCGGRGTRARG